MYQVMSERPHGILIETKGERVGADGNAQHVSMKKLFFSFSSHFLKVTMLK